MVFYDFATGLVHAPESYVTPCMFEMITEYRPGRVLEFIPTADEAASLYGLVRGFNCHAA